MLSRFTKATDCPALTVGAAPKARRAISIVAVGDASGVRAQPATPGSVAVGAANGLSGWLRLGLTLLHARRASDRTVAAPGAIQYRWAGEVIGRTIWKEWTHAWTRLPGAMSQMRACAAES